MYVCFLESHVVYTSSFLFKCCVLVSLNQKREIGSAFEQRGNTKWAEMEKSEGRECKSAQTLLILMMSTHLSTHWQKTTCESFTISVCDWAESLWAAMGKSKYEEGRTVTVEWISREHLITSVRGERLISFWSRCVFWMRTQCPIWLRQPQQGWGSQKLWCVECAFSKGCECFCHIFLNDKT